MKIVKILVFILIIFHSVYAQNEIDLLLDKLNSSADYKIKIASAMRLGKISNGSVAPELVKAYKKQTNKAVRLSIIQAISQIPETSILSQLLDLKNSGFLNQNEKLLIAQTLWSFRQNIDQDAWLDYFQKTQDRQKKVDSLWVLSASETDNIYTLLKDSLEQAKRPNYIANVLDLIDYFGDLQQRQLCKPFLNHSNARVNLKAKLCSNAKNKNNLYKKQINQEILSTQSYIFSPKLYEQTVQSKGQSLLNSNALAAVDESLDLNKKNSNFTDIQFKEKQVYTENINTSSLKKLENYGGELELIRNTIRKNMHLFNPCYQNLHSASKKVSGKLNMEFEVFSSGQLDNLKYIKSSINNQNLRSCFSENMKKIRFNEINLKSIKVQYTFSFE